MLLNPRYGAFGLVAYPIEFAFYFLSPFIALATCGLALIAAVTGNAFGMLACAALAAEELVSMLRGVPSALAKVIQMARACLSYARGTAAVEDRWVPPPRGL